MGKTRNARARSGFLGLPELWLWLCQVVVRWITLSRRVWTTLALRLDGWWTTMKPLTTTRPQGCPHPARVNHRTVLSASWQVGPFKGSLFFKRSKSTRPAAEEERQPGGDDATPREGRSPQPGDDVR